MIESPNTLLHAEKRRASSHTLGAFEGKFMYTLEKLIWTKNVKKDNGNNWAYPNIQLGNEFLLNWPTNSRGSYNTPKTGEIILLFQKVNTINNVRNYDVHLTHLVSPISDEVFIDDNSPNHKYCRKVKLLAKANPIDSIPNPGFLNFFLPNRGFTNPITNIRNSLTLIEIELQKEIWRLFKKYLCDDIINQNKTNNLPQTSVIEGDKITKNHIQFEKTRRNSKIIRDFKKKHYNESNGHLKCKCCNFDFLEKYGDIGTNFIECHHKNHLSNGKRKTTFNDLALVCSNCHRILHRKNNNGDFLTINELTNLLEDNGHKKST